MLNSNITLAYISGKKQSSIGKNMNPDAAPSLSKSLVSTPQVSLILSLKLWESDCY